MKYEKKISESSEEIDLENSSRFLYVKAFVYYGTTMNIINTGDIVLALISSGTLLWLAKKVLHFIVEALRRKDNSTRVLQKSAEIYESLNTIVASTEAKRAVVLTATNGGKIMRTDTDMYGSILYEIWEVGVSSRKSDWSKVRLGHGYISILTKLIQEKEFILETDDIKDLRLRNVYEADNIHHTFLLELTFDDEKYIYLSIAFQKSDIKLKPQDYVLIQTEVDKLRLLLGDS